MCHKNDDPRAVPPASVTYRARLRIRVLKKLNIAESSLQFSVDGRDVVIGAPTGDSPILDSEWLVLNTRGFGDESEARAFGERLQSALHLSSAATRLGVDPGRDLATSALATHVKEQVEKQTGAKVRDNVHGLDVFVDDPSVVIFGISGTGSVLASRDPFLAHAAELQVMSQEVV